MDNPNRAAKGMKTRKTILKYITDYIRKHGYPPTVREIGEGMIESDAGFSSPRAIRIPGYRFVKEDWNEA